jgi:hypothetical protein
MIRKLRTPQIQELLRLRETGMGYQFIEAETGYYGTKNKYLVLNSQMIIDDTPQILNEVKSVFKGGYRTMLFSASEVELKNIRLVENLSNYRVKAFSASKQTGAIHQSIVFANGTEVFTRLSAYEDDFRVDTVNKKLVPGSFSTTFDDYQYCKNNNINPVERYALPNDDEIKWAFHIRPLKTDSLQRGIVEPANNQNGGGVEAYFEKGTTNNTFLEKTAY